MYCILEDILNAIPEDIVIQLTDDDRTGNIIEPTVDAQIARADAVIDSYIAKKYSVPRDPVEAVINSASIDIAIYYLYSRKVEEIPSTRTDAYKNAIKLLVDIAAGKATLGEDDTPTKTTAGAELLGGNTRQMTREKLRGVL